MDLVRSGTAAVSGCKNVLFGLKRRLQWQRQRVRHAGDSEWANRIERVRRQLAFPTVEQIPAGSKIWAVTMVKNEADIIERVIRHLVQQGVDAVLVADNDSTDDTPQILERLAGELPVLVARDSEPAYYQAEKMTLLSRWAAAHGAQWIVPFDADELWFAPHGLLKDWLKEQPAGVVEASIHNLFPTQGGAWRLEVSPHLHPKVAFRAHPEVRLSMGNHDVKHPGKRAAGLRIIHIPWRSFEQFVAKVRTGARALELTDLDAQSGKHWRQTNKLSRRQLRELWNELLAGGYHPAVGWSPWGRSVVTAEIQWRTWDPDALLAPKLPPSQPEKQDPLTLIYARPPGLGWAPVTLMARQAGQLLGAQYLEIAADRPYGRLDALRGTLPRRRGQGTMLVIAPQPGDLRWLQQGARWLRGFERTVGWVIDSFWEDRIPRIARGAHFDQLFVTDGDLLEVWSERTGQQVEWLPWGAEVLGLPPLVEKRDLDLVRLGRQPATWEDDEEVARAAERAGLRYAGRPAFGSNVVEGQQLLYRSLSRAKYVLAFSNRHSPAPYTHPRHEYLTGRWTQALAAGATVAGIAPKCRASDELLWPGALLELPNVDRDEGLAAVAQAAVEWRPELAARHRALALERLDWRHRFQVLAKALERSTPLLDRELAVLAEAIEASA